MFSEDALLADLQASTTMDTTRSYNQQWSSTSRSSEIRGTSGGGYRQNGSDSLLRRSAESSDQFYQEHQPPRPPLPSQDVLNTLGYNSQDEMYLGSGVSPGPTTRPIYSSTITIEKTVKNGYDTDMSTNQSLGYISANPVYRGVSESPYLTGTSPYPGGGSYSGGGGDSWRRSPRYASTSPGAGDFSSAQRRSPSVLSNNLSTLDNLLQDLSSAQTYNNRTDGCTAGATKTSQQFRQPSMTLLQHGAKYDETAEERRSLSPAVGAVRVLGHQQLPQQQLQRTPSQPLIITVQQEEASYVVKPVPQQQGYSGQGQGHQGQGDLSNQGQSGRQNGGGRGSGGDIMNGRSGSGMSTASRDLEELMTSISEFDAYGNRPGETNEAQLLKIASMNTANSPNGMDQSNCSGDIRGPSPSLGPPLISLTQAPVNSQGLGAGMPSQAGDSVDGGGFGGSLGGGQMFNESMIQSSPSMIGQPVPRAQMFDQHAQAASTVVTNNSGLGLGGKGGRGVMGMQGGAEGMLVKLDGDGSQQLMLPKGNCAACDSAVIGQVLLALGRVYHPEHFTCAHCKQQLGTNIFYERDGQPFCERDYQMLFSPKCGLCNGAITDTCISAANQSWHPEHFVCVACGQPFGEAGFHEKDGKVYCSDDYFAMFAPKCGGCNKAILYNYISALHRQWHPECFVCQECGSPFDTGSFYDHEGVPFCEKHFHAKRGSLCASCSKPIAGRCIAAMYKKYHPEHFVCSFCLQPLNKGTFKEHSEKPYCHLCFDKLFG